MEATKTAPITERETRSSILLANEAIGKHVHGTLHQAMPLEAIEKALRFYGMVIESEDRGLDLDDGEAHVPLTLDSTGQKGWAVLMLTWACTTRGMFVVSARVRL